MRLIALLAGLLFCVPESPDTKARNRDHVLCFHGGAMAAIKTAGALSDCWASLTDGRHD